MFDKNDPRAALAWTSAPKRPIFRAYTPSDDVRFHEREANGEGPLQRTWPCRGQNAVIAYSQAKEGALFQRLGQLDEWASLSPDKSAAAKPVVEGKTHAIHTPRGVDPGVNRLIDFSKIAGWLPNAEDYPMSAPA